MKIHYLGTCSGTEPIPGMHHCSLVIEINSIYYWFDAGESCGYTAHTMGLDVTKTKALFVSHPHVDHVGGLPHLLFMMDKLLGRGHKKMIHANTLEVFFPDLSLFYAVKTVATSGGWGMLGFKLQEHQIRDGLLFEDENVRITALHNAHLNENGGAGWHAYSFLVEAEGKRIVYSGEVHEPYEVDALIGDGCDLLIMETGHHKVKDICEYAIRKNIPCLRFNHHGREIIGNRATAEELTAQYAKKFGSSIIICYDGMVEEI